MKNVFFFQSFCVTLTVYCGIVEIQGDVYCDEQDQRSIRPDNPVAVEEYLVCNAERIPKLDKKHESETLPLRRLGLYGLHYGERPRKAKTAQHQKLINTHFVSIIVLFRRRRFGAVFKILNITKPLLGSLLYAGI